MPSLTGTPASFLAAVRGHSANWLVQRVLEAYWCGRSFVSHLALRRAIDLFWVLPLNLQLGPTGPPMQEKH